MAPSEGEELGTTWAVQDIAAVITMSLEVDTVCSTGLRTGGGGAGRFLIFNWRFVVVDSCLLPFRRETIV